MHNFIRMGSRIEFVWKKCQGDLLLPDLITYNSAISCCDFGGYWQVAIELLSNMEQRRKVADVITLSTAVSVCAKGGQWQYALHLLSATWNISPNIIAFNAAITACEKGLQWQLALSFFHSMDLSPDFTGPLEFQCCNQCLWKVLAMATRFEICYIPWQSFNFHHKRSLAVRLWVPVKKAVNGNEPCICSMRCHFIECCRMKWLLVLSLVHV